MKNDEQFAAAMVALGNAFGRPFDKATMQTYWDFLDDVEDVDFAAGVRRFARGEDEWPTVGKIYEASMWCRARRRENEREAFFRKTGRIMGPDGSIGKTNEEIAEQKAKDRACAERMRAKREVKEAEEKAAKAEAAIAVEAAREARRIALDEAAVKSMRAVDTPEDPLARLRAASEYHQLRVKLNNELEAANSRAGRPTTGITSGQNAQGVPS